MVPQENPFVVLEPQFKNCIPDRPELELLWSGGEWVEGPVWLDQGRQLIWSDIPNNTMMSWSADEQRTSVFRDPSNGANGNTRDRVGRLVTCEQYSRRISRTEHDGDVSVLADRFKGLRFNAPNDIVVKSDGSIWFTDPDYGHSPEYQGVRELEGCHVYRLDPFSGDLQQMTNDFYMPNGLAFSPSEELLYIIDTGSTHFEEGPNHIRRFKVRNNSILEGGEVFARNSALCFDGLRVDIEGRLWCSAEDGVHCYSADGKLIGKILTPKRVGNLCFGEIDRSTMFICATDATYRCRVKARGI